MIDETTKYGHKYISPSCCTYGDYGGAGSVGIANVRAILEMEEFKDSILRLTYRVWENVDKWNDEFTDWQTIDEFKVHGPPKVVYLIGGYGSRTIWLLECEETDDIIACLANYPLLDDELHSQVEMEWEQEAWDGYIRHDLYCAMDEELQEAIDNKEPCDDKLFNAYRLAMESTNTYPTPEHAGVWVKAEDIQDEYEDNVRAILS